MLVATVGLVVLVLERFGVVRRLSWLDALMGASAAGAVAAAFGAEGHLVVGVGGATGALALSRWRPGPSVVLGAAGVLALAVGPAAAPLAAALLAAAAWRRDPRADPGPEFRWTVLVALIALRHGGARAACGGPVHERRRRRGGPRDRDGPGRHGARGDHRDRPAARERAPGADGRPDRPDQPPAPARPPRGGDRGTATSSRCCSSTSTASRSSTTRSATMPATRCCARSGRASRARCASTTRSRGSAATSSRSFSRPPTRRPPARPGCACAARSSARSSVEGIARPHRRQRRHRAVPRARGQRGSACCSARTSRCTRPSAAQRARGLPARARSPQPRPPRARSASCTPRSPPASSCCTTSPRRELASGAVHGVEALLRWEHPRRGLLAPTHFLPLAEQSGLTRDLTAFVARPRAGRRARRRAGTGRRCRSP